MTIQELILSNEYYSYKQLTELLEIPYLRGNAKTKQLNELCEMDKHPSKPRYKLTREYNEVDRELMSLSSKLIEPMLYLLYKDLMRTEGKAKSYSNDELLVLFGIVNSDAKYLRHEGYDELKDVVDLDNMYVDLDLYTISFCKYAITSMRNVIKRIDSNVGFKVDKKCFRLHRGGVNSPYERIDVEPESDKEKEILDIMSVALRKCGYYSCNYDAFMYYADERVKQYYFEICAILTKERLEYDRFTIVTRISYGNEALKLSIKDSEIFLNSYYKNKANNSKGMLDEFWDNEAKQFKIDIVSYCEAITDASCPLRIEEKLKEKRRKERKINNEIN